MSYYPIEFKIGMIVQYIAQKMSLRKKECGVFFYITTFRGC